MRTTTGFVLMTAVALAVPDLSEAEEVTPVGSLVVRGGP